ncbi:MAG: two-component system sensor histidine kinase VicK [Flavobacteriales bacterium]|jgi:two-component system sensor histidine kinase VicK|tara:strand:- start:17750 stop:18826 length:1077 start_codon:yes stop_codon:yes gene_type:complete
MTKDIEHRLLDELLSNINQVLFVRDAFTENHDIIYVNSAYESLWGRSKQSLIDDPASYIDSVHPEDREMVIGLYMRFLEGNIEYEKDFRIIRADGEVRWIFAKTFAIFNADGQVYRIAGFAEDITNRKVAEININRLNKVQSGVLKMLAHDLRTPIAGVKLTAGLLENANSETVKDCSEIIIDSCDNTLLMMDDLLSHIHMNSEGVFLNMSNTLVENEINKICGDFNVQVLQKNLKLKLPTSQTYLDLDAIKFKQIVTNLITNAIKFSHPGGEINIEVLKNENSVEVLISDQGIGISDELMPEVFDIFTRARKEGTNGEKSTGLGLSITKRLIELHEGKINISSELNKGTTVNVSFPN